MRTSTIFLAGKALTIDYPNSVAFMYSPQLVRVTGSEVAGAKIAVTLTHVRSGRQHTETRDFYERTALFDISRTMQLLAPDVDNILQRLSDIIAEGLTEAFSLSVSYVSATGQTTQILSVNDITGMYGALDSGEIYGEHSQRRLWVNFPQTFNLWENTFGETAFVLDDAYVYPRVSGYTPCHECDLIDAMLSNGDLEEFRRMLPEHPQRNIGLTWKTRIERGKEIPEEFRIVTLVPDFSKPGEGTYLRWLNRRGEVSYFLFKNSQIRVTSSISNTFSRYYDNDPSEPLAGAYNNAHKAEYREAREMVIGATGLSYDEFMDLCDLATSPVVERLMPEVPEEDTEVDVVYDGGKASTTTKIVVDSESEDTIEIEGGDAAPDRLKASQYLWQRVNVAAGTFARNIKRNTPNMQDLEIIIELPERNTIKL